MIQQKDAKNGRPTNYSCLSTCYIAIKDVIYTLEYKENVFDYIVNSCSACTTAVLVLRSPRPSGGASIMIIKEITDSTFPYRPII